MSTTKECWAHGEKCGKDFVISFVPLDLGVFLAHLRAMKRCPSCGAGRKQLSVYSPGLTPAQARAARGTP